jgi:hypothetical protein
MPKLHDEHGRTARTMTRPGAARRRVLVAVGLLALALVLASAAAVAGTRYDSRPERPLVTPGGPDAPAWSRPCWRHNPPPYTGLYTLPCVRVDGLVLYRQARDPDGDGDGHLLVVAGPHLVNLKFRRAAGVLTLPGPGHRVVVVGVRSEGRFGIPEVDVARMS